jgi:hypothetical protein
MHADAAVRRRLDVMREACKHYCTHLTPLDNCSSYQHTHVVTFLMDDRGSRQPLLNNIIVEDDDIDIPSIVQVLLSYFNIHAHI